MILISKSKNKKVLRDKNIIYKVFYKFNTFLDELYLFKNKKFNNFFPELISYDYKNKIIKIKFINNKFNNLNKYKKYYLIGKKLKELHSIKLRYYKLINDNNKIYFSNPMINRFKNLNSYDKELILKDTYICLSIRDLQIKNFLFENNNIYFCDLEEYEFSSKYVSLVDFILKNKLNSLEEKIFLKGYGEKIKIELLKIYKKYLIV